MMGEILPALFDSLRIFCFGKGSLVLTADELTLEVDDEFFLNVQEPFLECPFVLEGELSLAAWLAAVLFMVGSMVWFVARSSPVF